MCPRQSGDIQDPHLNLVAANGTVIKTYGKRRLTIHHSGKQYVWQFIIADVQRHYIGRDFLGFFNFLINMAKREVIQAPHDHLHLQGIQDTQKYDETQPNRGTIPPSSNEKIVQHLLKQFSDVFQEPSEALPKVRHHVTHAIETFCDRPIPEKPRRANPEKRTALRNILDTSLKTGLMRPSRSPYAAPGHVVQKPNGGWRLVGDYRALNANTKPDAYPLPHLHDFAFNMEGSKIFSKLDLVSAYHQIPMKEADIEKTAITTCFGLFEYVRMPFGLRNAGQTFQRMVDEIFRDLKFVFIYVDDLIIASGSLEEHLQHVKLALARLQEHGLVCSKKKCVWAVPTIDFLGYRLSSAGVSPQPSKVHAIRSYPKPDTSKALRRFLGLSNFYHRFIPHCADIVRPLNSMITPKDSKLSWSCEAEEAFEALKLALAEASHLVYPIDGASTRIVCDASKYAVGAVLEQFIDGRWRPISFFSKKMSTSECRYSTYDRELLAMYLAVRHFKHFVEGTVFHILTDQKPLQKAIRTTSTTQTETQARRLAYIALLTSDVRFIKGEDNVVADSLSRAPTVDALTLSDPLLLRVASAQADDPSLTHMAKNQSRYQTVHVKGVELLCDCKGKRPKALVPSSEKVHVMTILHHLGHPGIRATRQLISTSFVWAGMSKDIQQFVRSCLACQQSKVSLHERTPVHDFQIPSTRFANIHVDIVGPLPISEGFSYLFTVIDRFTRFPAAYPMKTQTTSECVTRLLEWIALFGMPETIVSDRGGQFESELWNAVIEILGIKHNRTTSYHPQSNGMIERVHRSLKDSLRCLISDDHAWLPALPVALLRLRSTLKPDIGFSPSQMAFGLSVRLPGTMFEAVIPDINSQRSEIRNLMLAMNTFSFTAPKRHGHASAQHSADLDNATFVFVHDPTKTGLGRPYRGPFPVLERNAKYFRLDIDGKVDNISINRLKAAVLDECQGTRIPSHTTIRGRHVYAPVRLDC